MGRTVIDFDGVSFSYPDGRRALSNIDLKIEHGEKVAVIGPNGSGKSTLLLLMNGVLRNPTGSITIDGMTIAPETIGQIRSKIGLTFQNPDDQLFSLHVYDDVAFGPRHMGLNEDKVDADVEEALRQVGSSHLVHRLSHHLSEGEKKRVALATILSMGVSILALDEPSAGLDPRGRRNLIALLNTFTTQTLVISTHDMRFAHAICDRVVVLDNGTIVADGLSRTLLVDEALMEKHGLEAI